MDPLILLSHLLVALVSLSLGALVATRWGRRNAKKSSQPLRSTRPERAGDGASRQASQTVVPSLDASHWTIAALEGALAARDASLARVQADADARVEAMRLRLLESERMAHSLQLALEASVPQPPVIEPAEPDPQIPLPLPDALSATLERIHARVDSLSQSLPGARSAVRQRLP
jgi:hypothetical protein